MVLSAKIIFREECFNSLAAGLLVESLAGEFAH